MLAILQFDSAALPLIEAMLADGRLPTLAGLRARGTWTPIDGLATFLQSSTYPTLCTGIDVREHGIYSAIPWSPAEQRARFMQDLPRPRTIWERLTEAGRPSLIVDPYLPFAPEKMAGIYLSGVQFEDRMVMQRLSVPRDQHRILQRRFGAPPKLDDVYGTKQSRYLVEWRDHLIAAPGRAADQVIDLLSSNSFDLLWLNFGVSHKAGHHLWDPASVVDGSLDPETGARPSHWTGAGVPGRRYGNGASSGGPAQGFGRDRLLPHRNGAEHQSRRLPSRYARSGADQWNVTEAIRSGAFITLVHSLENPRHLAVGDAQALPDRFVADLTTKLYTRADWSKTRAIAVPGENKGYIRLNLRGREREGIVDPAEADKLIDTIIQGLLTFHDPDGSASITKVERMKDLAGGKPYAQRLPDLVVFWGDRPANGLTHVSSPQFGEIPRRGVGSGRTGNHTDDAWAIVVPGRSRLTSLDRPAWITDIGATACHLLGADMTGLSGKSLLEVAS